MEHQEFDFNFHNTNFFGQYFKANLARAAVILVHGMGEHSGRYVEFVIPKLLENNISVITYDQFGHGKTEGKKGHNPGFDIVLNAVTQIVGKAKSVFGEIPFFLYGHSMGGNVVINYILRKKHNFKGAIATSPLLRLAFKPPSWKLTAGKFMQKIAPSITLPSELDPNAISRIPEEVEKYKNDPLVHDKISPNYSLVFFDSGEWAIQNASQLKTPMLVLHGTEDQLTDHKASEEFTSCSNNMAKLELFEGGYHELHNDVEKEKFMNIIINWILENIN